MRIYSDIEVQKLQNFEQMFFNPVNGEAVMFFPKPEVDPDAPSYAVRSFRDRDVYVGTGLSFEPAFQKLPMTGENPDTSRQAQPVAPWNFATAETVNVVTDAIQPVLDKLNAAVAGVGLAKQNLSFPYVHSDGSPLRSRELLINTQNGHTLRVSVGQLAAMLAHSTHEVAKEVFAFAPQSVHEDLIRQITGTTGTGSGATDVDMEPEVEKGA